MPSAANTLPPIRTAVQQARWRRFEPSVPDFVFAAVALAVPLLLVRTLLNSDGDLARHLRVGEHILGRRALFYADPFSYTMGGQPFVPFEWLSEVLFALAYRWGGLAGVAVGSGLLIASVYLSVALFLRRRGVDPLLVYLASMSAAVLGSMHWLARPHLFTLLGAVLLIELLEGQGKRRLVGIAALFAVWANLHGGFLFGLIVIGVYLAGDLAEAWIGERRAEYLSRARSHAMVLGVALLATLLNPSGLAVLPHVMGYLGETFLIAETQEYQSPNFHLLNGRVFLAALAIMLVAFASTRRRMPAPHFLLVLVTTAFALHSQRNIPLFALTAWPVMALFFDEDWRRLPGRAIAHVRSAFATDRDRMVGAWSVGVLLLLVALGSSGGHAFGAQLIRAEFDGTRFPVAAVERARAAQLEGRLYNEFSWGGYLLHAWPEQQVFIDAQTDFYGEELTRRYLKIGGLEPGWDEELRRWEVDLVLVPSHWGLVYELERRPEWEVWYRDGTAALLRRRSAATHASLPAQQPGS